MVEGIEVSGSPAVASAGTVGRKLLPLWACLGGTSLGWLMGLSASPVTSSAIGVVLGGIIGALATSRKRDEVAPDLTIVFAVVMGMGLGAPMGVLVRSHELLGGPPTQHEEAVRQVAPTSANGVLFAGRESICHNLDGTGDGQLRSMLGAYPELRSLLDTVTDSGRLRRIVGDLCDGASR
jgi:hypothetical protein